MNRRVARAIVLALFVTALLGPWDAGPEPLNFFEWVFDGDEAHGPWYWVFTCCPILPVAGCLAAVLSPSRLSRLYQVVLGAVGCLLLPLALLLLLSVITRGLPGEWGVSVYGVALVLAVLGELPRGRRTPGRDYAEVFR